MAGAATAPRALPPAGTNGRQRQTSPTAASCCCSDPRLPLSTMLADGENQVAVLFRNGIPVAQEYAAGPVQSGSGACASI